MQMLKFKALNKDSKTISRKSKQYKSMESLNVCNGIAVLKVYFMRIKNQTVKSIAKTSWKELKIFFVRNEGNISWEKAQRLD